MPATFVLDLWPTVSPLTATSALTGIRDLPLYRPLPSSTISLTSKMRSSNSTHHNSTLTVTLPSGESIGWSDIFWAVSPIVFFILAYYLVKTRPYWNEAKRAQGIGTTSSLKCWAAAASELLGDIPFTLVILFWSVALLICGSKSC